jgi:hypothetical protein
VSILFFSKKNLHNIFVLTYHKTRIVVSIGFLVGIYKNFEYKIHALK